MSIDIKDFYLKTPMSRYEYFCMKLELFPEDIIEEYDLRNKVDANRNVHCEVRRGMYGLPQALPKYPLQFRCNFAFAVLDDDSGDLLEYRHLIKHLKYKDTWSQSFGKEIRRLATTTETIFFINKQEIPNERKGDVTYGRIVCVYRDGKKDKYRTRITMGGNLINYPGDCGTPTANLLTVKLIHSSICK